MGIHSAIKNCREFYEHFRARNEITKSESGHYGSSHLCIQNRHASPISNHYHYDSGYSLRRIGAFGVAALFAFSISTPSVLAFADTTPAASSENPFVLDHGHTDIFDVSAPNDNQLDLKVKEDVSGLGVLREPENVLLTVKPDRFTTLPKKFADKGMASGYLLPQVQENDSLWPGWDTFGVRPHFTSIDIVLDKVSGPGKVFAFEIPLDQSIKPIASNNNVELTSGSRMNIPSPTHTHMYWLFTKKGIYHFNAHVEGRNSQDQLVKSRNAVYTWVVDSKWPEEKPQPASTVTTNPASSSSEKPTSTHPTTQPSGESTAQPTPNASDKPSNKPSDGESSSKPTHTNTPEEPSLPSSASSDTMEAQPTPSSDSKESDKKAEEKDEHHDGKKKVSDQKDDNALSHAPLVAAPETMNNSSSLNAQKCVPTKVPYSQLTTSEKQRYDASLRTGGSTQQYGSVTIPKNTHVHQNWVFNKPGRYEVTITESTTLKNGKRVSADTTLHFNVGGSGNANEGHFDLGAKIVNNQLVPSMKDDRKQPAQWIDPGSVVFGLGDKSRQKAIPEMSFIADNGQDVWMIPSVQIAGVPWLGANTMSATVEELTDGTLTWTLKSVKGPGQLAVFESGNLGKVIGKRWFGGRSGKASTGSTSSVKKTDPHTLVTVGRTPSGQPCSLAQTGVSSSTVPTIFASGALMVIGLMVMAMQYWFVLRRRSYGMSNKK